MKLRLIFFMLFSGNLLADELYEFKKIDCMIGIQTFSFRDVKLWNIGDFGVWGSGGGKMFDSWGEHESALKRMEVESGLYIFNQEYGWHDNQDRISCDLDNGFNKLTIKIEYTSNSRYMDTPIGPGKPLRWNPVLSVLHSEYGLIYRAPGLEISELTVVNESSAVQLRVCKNDSCLDARYDGHDFKNNKPLPLNVQP